MKYKDMKSKLESQKRIIDKWNWLISYQSPILRSEARKEGLIE